MLKSCIMTDCLQLFPTRETLDSYPIVGIYLSERSKHTQSLIKKSKCLLGVGLTMNTLVRGMLFDNGTGVITQDICDPNLIRADLPSQVAYEIKSQGKTVYLPILAIDILEGRRLFIVV